MFFEEASCQTRFFEAKCIFCWQGRGYALVRVRFALCFFREASYQTRFFETKVRFLMAWAATR